MIKEYPEIFYMETLKYKDLGVDDINVEDKYINNILILTMTLGKFKEFVKIDYSDLDLLAFPDMVIKSTFKQCYAKLKESMSGDEDNEN